MCWHLPVFGSSRLPTSFLVLPFCLCPSWAGSHSSTQVIQVLTFWRKTPSFTSAFSIGPFIKSPVMKIIQNTLSISICFHTPWNLLGFLIYEFIVFLNLGKCFSIASPTISAPPTLLSDFNYMMQGVCIFSWVTKGLFVYLFLFSVLWIASVAMVLGLLIFSSACLAYY